MYYLFISVQIVDIYATGCYYLAHYLIYMEDWKYRTVITGRLNNDLKRHVFSLQSGR